MRSWLLWLAVAACCSTAIGAVAQSQAPGRPLVGKRWTATELAGKTLRAVSANREAYLQLEDDGRVSGSDGCNRLTGSYTVSGDTLTFGRMVATQMACLDLADTDRTFREALQATARWRIVDNRLEILGAAGTRLALFEVQSAAAPIRASGAASPLQGTSWQLVGFQSGDGTIRRPDDRAKYTIQFGANARLNVRLDCNRGQGGWRSFEPSGLEFGPLALTRAVCPQRSLHDQLVKHWDYVRSYVIKDGHLFLALMADGGIYEFEPLAVPGK